LLNGDTILGSGTLGLEIAAIRNPEKRAKVADLCQVVTERIAHSDSLEQRAKQLQLEGLHVMDSFHVASAEIGQADIFLTVDDRLIKLCRKKQFAVRVMNPLEYIEEVLEYEG
jgi:predicted nucleic acid-binding protein